MNAKEFELAIGRGAGPTELNRFLAFGGDINLRLEGPQPTFLHVAVESENLQMIEALVSEGADIQARSSEGSTPLHHAVEFDLDSAGQTTGPRDGDFLRALTFSTTRVLIELGAALNSVMADGRTPRDLAAAYGPGVLSRFDALTGDATLP